MKTWDSGKLARDQEKVTKPITDVHDKIYRFGTLVVDFPNTPNYPVEIRRDGVLAVGEYRGTLKRGCLGGQPFTEAETMWLLGFDDEVADHEQAYRAMVER